MSHSRLVNTVDDLGYSWHGGCFQHQITWVRIQSSEILLNIFCYLCIWGILKVTKRFKAHTGHSRPLFSYCRLFNTVDNNQVNKQMFNKILPMTGVEPRTSGIESNCSTNLATTISHTFYFKHYCYFACYVLPKSAYIRLSTFNQRILKLYFFTFDFGHSTSRLLFHCLCVAPS